MKRREFSMAAAGAAALGLVATTGCGGGGGGSGGGGASAGDASAASAHPFANETDVVISGPVMGTNLSGMEWAKPGLRYGQSTRVNLNYTVPRPSDVAYLPNNAFRKNRLPIQWELLQPVLHDTVANATVQSVVGVPGARYARASDEHGSIELDGPGKLVLGEKVRLIPGHCDPTVNLYDWLVCHRGDRVEDIWPISARGAFY